MWLATVTQCDGVWALPGFVRPLHGTKKRTAEFPPPPDFACAAPAAMPAIAPA